MGESQSARTERELADLRRKIDADVDALIERAKADADPRHVLRRQPIAALGALGSIAALAGVSVSKKVRAARTKTSESDIDRIAGRLGGRVDRLHGRDRKRFRESLRKEIDGVQGERRGPQDALWAAGTAAATAAATALVRRFAGRLAGDDKDGAPRF